MKTFRRIADPWFREERAQDVAEYCLLTALIVLIGFAIFWHVSGGIQGMWASSNSSLSTARNAASPANSGVTGY